MYFYRFRDEALFLVHAKVVIPRLRERVIKSINENDGYNGSYWNCITIQKIKNYDVRYFYKLDDILLLKYILSSSTVDEIYSSHVRVLGMRRQAFKKRREYITLGRLRVLHFHGHGKKVIT